MAKPFIALIPARGGSKGVPRKNLEIVGSQSLLERAVLSGQGGLKISACYVSSEDEEILAKAAGLGALTHQRETTAATDTARASDVVNDFLASHSELSPDTRIVYLQPTSSFRTSGHVDAAIELMESCSADAVVSVVRTHQLPEKALVIAGSGALGLGPTGVDPGANRQRLAETVYPNGAIYIFTVGAFRRSGEIPVFGSMPFMMSKVESIDIDDSEDLMIARAVADSAGI